MSAKRTYTVETEVGTFTRTTARTYTHVVVGRHRERVGVDVVIPEDTTFGVIGFCGSERLAFATVQQRSTSSRWDDARKKFVRVSPGPFAEIRVYALDGTRVR